MKKLLFILFLVPTLSFSQGCQYGGKNGDIAQICDFYRGNNFATNLNAEKALDRILNVTGMSKRFVLYECSNIENCVATSYKGIRYILYDKEFMEDIAQNTNSWTKLSILAHEIGHHVNGHSLDLLTISTGHVDAPSLKQSREMELEADEYSGFIMQKLGATLSEAQAAVGFFASEGDDTFSTHPNKSKRLNAVEVGYNKASDNSIKGLTTEKSAEDYFYKGMNSQDDNSKVENFTMAINLNCKKKDLAYINRGLTYGRMNMHQQAILDFNKAIDMGTEYVEAYLSRGKAYELLGDFNNAYFNYKKATDVDPNFVKSYFNMGELLQNRLKDPDLEVGSRLYTELSYKAFAYYTIAITKNPQYSDAYFKRGNLYMMTEIYDKALEDYNNAIEYISNAELFTEVEAYYNKGYAKDKLEFYIGSILDYSWAINLNPNFLDAYINRGIVYVKMKKRSEACDDFRQACMLGECEVYNKFCK